MRIQLALGMLAVPLLQAGELELKPETLQSWNEHVQKATLAMQKRSVGAGPFLPVDEDKDRVSRVRKGEIVVWQTGESSPKRVPSGLIHDWMGAAFIPNVRVEDVYSVTRNYSLYREIYKPGVVDAKLVKQAGGEDRFTLLLRNLSYFTKTAIDSEYKSSHIQLDEHRWYSVSCSSRVQEIENFGLQGEHKLPPDEGHGYLWRMCSLSQLEERDGGVYVNEEMMALSRDMPTALRWMAGPIIRRVARETLTESIGRTRGAVGEKAHETNVAAKGAGGVEAAGCARNSAVGCLR